MASMAGRVVGVLAFAVKDTQKLKSLLNRLD